MHFYFGHLLLPWTQSQHSPPPPPSGNCHKRINAIQFALFAQQQYEAHTQQQQCRWRHLREKYSKKPGKRINFRSLLCVQTNTHAQSHTERERGAPERGSERDIHTHICRKLHDVQSAMSMSRACARSCPPPHPPPHRIGHYHAAAAYNVLSLNSVAVLANKVTTTKTAQPER